MTLKDTHFNATELLRELRPQLKEAKTKLKVAHFLDNKQIQRIMTLPPDITRGPKGATWVQNELRDLFVAWLSFQKDYPAKGNLERSEERI